MTWQGGKLGRQAAPTRTFACLTPLATPADDTAASLTALSQALSTFSTAVTVSVRLLGGEDETVEHWDVQAGSGGAKAVAGQPRTPDVIVVMRPETWQQIAQGRLAPYEALYAGKLRVGGDFDVAKAITRHLSDPASSYVAPC
ncbi:MAG: SCP2 sterol-binding domain-containing protein [Specibacter sp.]